MDATQILSIPLDQPWKLFRDPLHFDEMCRTLRRKWFPDFNKDPKATEVMAHINVLIDKYKQDPNVRVAWLNRYEIPGIGRCAIESERVTFQFDYDASDFKANMLAHTFRFADDKMINSMSPLLPVFWAGATRNDVVIRKPKEELNLADILASQGGTLPEKHVAWILSRLYSIACYLDYSNLAHVDISTKNLYVNPKQHTVHLYGGWWYARKFGEKALGAPSWVVDLSMNFAGSGIPNRKLVSEQIKQVGRELLGYPSIPAMANAIMLPKPLVQWLSSPGSHKPLGEYTDWMHCLEQSFGPRKFIEFNVTEKDVYPHA